MKYVALCTVLLFAAVIACFSLFGEDDSATRGRFHIAAQTADVTGVASHTVFRIVPAEGEELTEAEIRENLRIEPSLSYTLTSADDEFLLTPDEPLAAAAIYRFRYLFYQTAFEVQQPLAVTAITPDGRGGVALDEAITVSFNQTVTLDAAASVTISPQVKGSWRVSDNRLIFTPKRYEPGRIYTVSVDGAVNFDGSIRMLDSAAAASFETQDTAERIPSTSAFTVSTAEMTVQPAAQLAIPVVLSAPSGATVQAEVWRTDDAKQYIETVRELTALADWATIGRAAYRCDLAQWQQQAGTQLLYETTAAGGFLTGTAPAAGFYLYRLTAAGSTYDLAVIASPLSACLLLDGNQGVIWAHRDGKAAAGATVTGAGGNYTLDENGTATVAAGPDEYLLLQDGEDTLPLRAVAAPAGATLCLEPTVAPGADTAFGGYLTVFGALPYAAEVVVVNNSGDLLTVSVAVAADGFFSGSLPTAGLMAGDYRAELRVRDQTLATASFAVRAAETEPVTLTITPSATTVKSGEELQFTVTARDAGGAPVSGLAISADSGGAVRTSNENGETFFYERLSLPAGVRALTEYVTFRALLPDGSTLRQSLAITVSNGGVALNIPPTPAASAETLPFARTERRLLPTEGDGVLALHYDGASYTADSTPRGVLLPAAADSYTVAAGQTLAIRTKTEAPAFVTASLYLGAVPTADALPAAAAVATAIGRSGQTLELPSTGLNGDYYLRITACAPGYESGVSLVPVQVDGLDFRHDLGGCYDEGEAISFTARCDQPRAAYRLTLTGEEELTLSGSLSAATTIAIGELPIGRYTAVLTATLAGRTAYRERIAFEVCAEEPLFSAVHIDAPSDDDYLRYQTMTDQAEKLAALLRTNLLPGDQLLQVVARRDFSRALPERQGNLALYAGDDVTAYQNADGSFSRVRGGNGDLLLCALMARSRASVYDRDALAAYIRHRLETTAGDEVPVLAYWGLAALEQAPLQTMRVHLEDRDLTLRERLYLTEAFAAAGDLSTANLLYDDIREGLQEDGGGLYLASDDEQGTVFCTLLLTDLAIILNRADMGGLCTWLLDQEPATITNRYLYAQCLLRLTDMSLVTPAGDTVAADMSVVSVSALDSAELPELPVAFRVNGAAADTATVGDGVAATVQWDGGSNDLFLVTFRPQAALELLESDGWHIVHGVAQRICSGESATVSWLARLAATDAGAEIYVMDLTTGALLGVTADGLTVVKE